MKRVRKSRNSLVLRLDLGQVDVRAEIELELAKDVGLEADTQNSLEKRNCHETGGPPAREETRLAV